MTLPVVRGRPTPQELAALVVVLSAHARDAPPAATPLRPRWARPVLRSPLTPGPGAWRASALPR